MRLSYRTLLLFFLLLGIGGVTQAQQKKNVILYIGDGFGVAPKTAARLALGQGQDGSRFSDDPNFQLLALDQNRFQGMVTSHSLNSLVTDSAPGAAVYASGKAGKVDNEFITMSPETLEPIETVLEAAKKEGYAVGLVTSTRITHATPATFATHIWNRDLENYIAAQYISASQAEYEEIFNQGVNGYDRERDWILPEPKIGVEVDVLLGGGSRHFLPRTTPNVNGNNTIRDAAGVPVTAGECQITELGRGSREDEVDLVEIAKNRGFQYVNSRDALWGVLDRLDEFTPDNDAKLLGLFEDSHKSYEAERQVSRPCEPALWELTKVAIAVLQQKSEKGFFLVVEGGRIDHLEHANAGGITYAGTNYQVKQDDGNQTIIADDVYVGGTATLDGANGGEYMIKEVLDFDYSVAEGRALLNQAGATLLLTTSDHECAGFSVVGLTDVNDAQANGTLVRTYAQQPVKTNGSFTPVPVTIDRGDDEIGGWFPDYSMVEYQGKMWPVPGQRRIVISYGSNPITNGNGLAIGNTPGNHTPQDIWVSGDDNVGGQFAGKLNGRGLLDNTDLYPIMTEFLLTRPVGAPAVTRLVVVDADTGDEVAVLRDGASIDAASLPARVNVVALATGSVKSVHFNLNSGYYERLEVLAPFALFGDANGVFRSGDLPVGTHTLTATPYTGYRGQGAAGAALTVSFSITGSSSKAASLPKGRSEEGVLNTTEALPTAIELDANYPNPFNPETTITFGLPEATDVHLRVYDVQGRTVATLVEGQMAAGRHDVRFDATHLPSGTYFYQLMTAAGTVVKQMALLK